MASTSNPGLAYTTNKKFFIACLTISEDPVPPMPSITAICFYCKVPLWLSFDTISLVTREEGSLKNGEPCCWECVLKYCGDSPVRIYKEQLETIRKARN